VILTKAPLRISLAGGGSDIPSFYKRDFGEVLSFTIDKYVYIASHSYFSGGIRLSYSKTEFVKSIHEIEHPLFRNTMKYMNFSGDLELSSFADVPGTGTGLGSSSAFTVALIRTLLEFKNNTATAKEIAEIACEIEIGMCNDPIGKQDQFASAIGGVNRFRFNSDNTVTISDSEMLNSKIDFLNKSFLLYYTGKGRLSKAILEEQSAGMLSGSNTYDAVVQIRDTVQPMEDCIKSEDIIGIGEILGKSWNYKRSLSPSISNSNIDHLIVEARKLGALAGKLVGAGGGGFLLLCVPYERRDYFKDKFNILRNLPFNISNNGVEVVYSDEVVE
jgi:D-glycero-alpha-D-manno-heptose-7-phosphate kinase